MDFSLYNLIRKRLLHNFGSSKTKLAWRPELANGSATHISIMLVSEDFKSKQLFLLVLHKIAHNPQRSIW